MLLNETGSAPPWSEGVTKTTTFTPGNHPAAADLDGDDWLDMVLTEPDGYYRIFRNDKNKGFYSVAYDMPSTGGWGGARLVDFNLDGLVDIFLAGLNAKEKYLPAVAAFDYSKVGYEGSHGVHTHNLDVLDVDGDGRLDIITGSENKDSSSDYRYVVRNNTAKGQMAKKDMFVGLWSSEKLIEDLRGDGDVYVADFNDDRKWDLLVPRNAGVTQRNAMILLNKSNTYTTSTSDWRPPPTITHTLPVAAVDLEPNGSTDAVIRQLDATGQSTAIIAYANGTPKGSTTLTFTTKWTVVGKKITLVRFADLDGDTKPDMVYGADGALNVCFSSMLVSGCKTPVKVGTGSVSSIVIRDFDNDGDLDILAAMHSDNAPKTERKVIYLKQDPAKSFTGKVVLSDSTGDLYHVFAMGDLSGAPAAGIKVTADHVQVKNFKAIRGFSVGVDVEADGAKIGTTQVASADIAGFRFGPAAKIGLLEDVSVTGLHMGAGLAAKGAGTITVSKARLCNEQYSARLTPQSVYCTRGAMVPVLKGSGNHLHLNNGCDISTLTWTSCK